MMNSIALYGTESITSLALSLPAITGGHSLRVPFPFKLEEPYVVYGFDDMTDDQIDLVTETMKKRLTF